MSELKPIRIGDRVTKFPALTHNALIAGEQKRRNALTQIDDLRKPKQKLPCVVRIAWAGASDLPPGSTVKLGNVLFEPSTDAWAPYEGLAFYADEFSTGESAMPYAVTLDPIKAKAGTTYQLGDAVIPQAWWCKLDVSDAGHEYAARPDSGTVMVSATSGDRVLWKESGTGEKWAVVAMASGGGGSETIGSIRLARVTAEISKRTSNLTENWGAGSIHLLNDTTGEEITEDTYDAFNPYPFVFVADATVEVQKKLIKTGEVLGVDVLEEVWVVRNGTCTECTDWEATA